MVRLLCNNDPLACRITSTSVTHIGPIATHLSALNIEPVEALRTLLSGSVKMIDKLPSLAAKVASLKTERELKALIQSVRGQAHPKRNKVADSL